jgi:hypothetical protein
VSTITVEERRPQQLQALERAQATRRELRRIRGWLREPGTYADSRDRLAELLIGDPPRALTNQRVFDVLLWCRGMQPGRATTILATAGVAATRRVGRLTPRQCFAIAGQLRHGHYDRARPAAALAGAVL